MNIDVKEGYEESNQLFNFIPKNAYAKWLAKSNIKKFNNHRYGALEWKTLKEYYDQDVEKIIWNSVIGANFDPQDNVQLTWWF